MKAVAVLPGKPNSVHLADLPTPSVNDVPNTSPNGTIKVFCEVAGS